jgi:hypothetical protein
MLWNGGLQSTGSRSSSVADSFEHSTKHDCVINNYGLLKRRLCSLTLCIILFTAKLPVKNDEKSEVSNTHNNKYYTTRLKTLNSVTMATGITTRIFSLIGLKIPYQQIITSEPNNLATNIFLLYWQTTYLTALPIAQFVSYSIERQDD